MTTETGAQSSSISNNSAGEMLRSALAHHHGGQLEQAAVMYEQVIGSQPLNADAWHLLGLLQADRGMPELAQQSIQKAIEISPANPWYHNSKGELFRYLGRQEEALKFFEQAVSLKPDYWQAWNSQGVMLLRLGNLTASIKAFNESIRINPDSYKAMRNRGRACFELLKRGMGRCIVPPSAIEDVVREGAECSRVVSQAVGTYLYCPQKRFLYAPIPKVACSSFKMLIYQIMLADLPELPTFPQDRVRRNFHIFVDSSFSLSLYPVQIARRILDCRDVFNFTFVRNPLNRIASAYLDKFVVKRHRRDQWEHTNPVLRSVYGDNIEFARESLTFRQFVKYLVDCGDGSLDKHWVPMTRIVDSRLMDFVGRVENIERDYEVLRQRLELSRPLPHINRATAKGLLVENGRFADSTPKEIAALPGLPSAPQLYDAWTEQAVRNRYREDFSVFGYA